MFPKDSPRNTSRTVTQALLLAPLIFILHVLEESPGFVGWFNSHVAPGITLATFWQVNISALLITLLLLGLEWLSRSAVSLTLVIAWLGFLMFANAMLHITGALVDQQYVPGLITAVVLYLPYFCWLFVKAKQSLRVQLVILIAVTLVGSTPMLVHGYLIIFRGSRLF